MDGLVPKRAGARYRSWSTGGSDDFVLVFVKDELTDIVWQWATSGETEFQQAFKDDPDERAGRPAFEGKFDVWHIGKGVVRRSCWHDGDSGDGGCAYAVARGR